MTADNKNNNSITLPPVAPSSATLADASTASIAACDDYIDLAEKVMRRCKKLRLSQNGSRAPSEVSSCKHNSKNEVNKREVQTEAIVRALEDIYASRMVLQPSAAFTDVVDKLSPAQRLVIS